MKALFKQKQKSAYSDLNNDIKELSKYDLLRQYLPYIEILSDNKTILTKNNTLIRVVKIKGIDDSILSSEKMQTLFNIRKNFFLQAPRDLKLDFYHIRRKLTDKITKKDVGFANKYAQEISDSWSMKFKDRFVNDIYLVISKKANINRNLDQFDIKLNASIKDLDANVMQITSLLSNYGARDLDNSNNYQLFRFFSYLVNNYEFIGSDKSELFNNLSLSDITFNISSGIIKIQNDYRTKYSKVIGVRVNTNYSNNAVFKVILNLSHELTLIQKVQTFSRQDNRKYIENLSTDLNQFPVGSGLSLRAEELNEALELVNANLENFLDYTCYIKVFGNSEVELELAVRDVQNTLKGEGIISSCETIGAKLAYLSCLPDLGSIFNKFKTSSRSRIKTGDVSDFIGLYSHFEGFDKCSFGNSSVVNFKTTSSANYGFIFHKNEQDRVAGHTLCIGSTGSGKTMLMSFLLQNCLKFPDIKMLCFDSKQGLKIPTTVFGGKYTTIGKDDVLDLNPMLLDQGFANETFQLEFIKMLAGDVSKQEEEVILEAIRQNYLLDKADRSLSELKLAFGNKEFDQISNQPSLASRLSKWIDLEDNNRYAKFFNSKQDSLDFTSNTVSFDMNAVLNDKSLLHPLSSYIFHKFNQEIEKNPTPNVLFVDEFLRYLESDNFIHEALTSTRESRKKNGIFVGCVTDARSLVQHPNGSKILNNIVTLIIFPDSDARPEDYMDHLGLSDSEFHWVKSCSNPRHVMIKKKDTQSIVIDADLSSLGKNIHLFSSNDSNVRIMEEERAQSNDASNNGNPDWVEQYLKRV